MDNSLDPSLDPSMQLTGKKMGKGPVIAIAVVAVAGIGGVIYWNMKQRELRGVHVAFLERYGELEKKDVGAFWACLMGDKVDPNQIANNLALNQRIEGSFNADLKGYPKRVTEECTPKLVDAKKKIGSLDGPSDYDAPLKEFGKALDDMAASFDEWAKVAPAQVLDREIGKKVPEAGNAWHAHAGKPANDVIRYDRFLRCAVPTLDAMKSGQDLVQFIASKMKDQVFLQRVNGECAKELVADPPGALDKNFARTQKVLAGDDRDVTAFEDVLRKARKGQRKDDFEGIDKSWVAYVEAGKKIRAIGKEWMTKTHN